jgi:hypothetical protein
MRGRFVGEVPLGSLQLYLVGHKRNKTKPSRGHGLVRHGGCRGGSKVIKPGQGGRGTETGGGSIGVSLRLRLI